MLIPDFIYGHALDVKKACRKAARKILKEKDFFSVCEENILDTKDINVSYCDEYPNSTINHYKLIFIRHLLVELTNIIPLPWENTRPYVEAALKKPWSFFMMITGNNSIWISNLKLESSFFQNLINFWDILNKEVITYGVKGCGKKELWKQSTSIHALLHHSDVPKEELDKEKNNVSIKNILEKYNLL